MNITIFNRSYWIRRFGEQKNVRGYVTTSYTDFKANLHIHPSSTDQMQALPEGERKIKRLQGHGTDVLQTADETTGQKGDLLYYGDRWYECVNAQEYDHTILCHLNYDFVLVPEDAESTIDLSPPSDE